MSLRNLINAFARDESGAVTVDWVVLTAAIVGLGLVVVTTIGGTVENLAVEISADVDDIDAGYVSTTTTP